MFTKKKKVAQITAYKKVIDWDAILSPLLWVVFFGFLYLFLHTRYVMF